jgi:hypothetical protein
VHHFDTIGRHALERLALVIARRRHRTRAFGLAVVAFEPADPPSLINLGGIAVAPDPAGTGGEGRMPAVNDVGEPRAKEPHARFDEEGAGNEASTTYDVGLSPRRVTAGHMAARPSGRDATAPPARHTRALSSSPLRAVAAPRPAQPRRSRPAGRPGCRRGGSCAIMSQRPKHDGGEAHDMPRSRTRRAGSVAARAHPQVAPCGAAP